MAFFITLDGTEGAGKTTQKALLEQWFKEKNLPVYFTREIGGTPIGEEIREWVLHRQEELTPEAELLLIFASRHQHVEKVIKPKLKQGISVISDRFIDSTYAYQGYGHGLSLAQISQLERFVLGDFRPHLSFILMADAETSKKRLSLRGQDLDKMERQNQAFFARVRAGFEERAKLPNTHLISTNGTIEAVHGLIIQQVEALYGSLASK